MNTLNRLHQHISALYDGEFAASETELAFAKLGGLGERSSWSVYQKIGDVLRADRAGFDLSEGFSARMSARLAAEPAAFRVPVNGTPRTVKVNSETDATSSCAISSS